MAGHFLNILHSTALRAVFTTLAHSLWLGAIMALLAGIIMILTKRSGSLLRYRLLTGLLILFAASIVYMFYNAFAGNSKTFTVSDLSMVSSRPDIQQLQNLQQQKTVFNNLPAFIGTYAHIIVSIWFIVICFKCARLIYGFRSLHRLKKTNVLEAGTYWVERMNELTVKIGITKKVMLVQSSLAKIPMVIGHLKPIILFPIGLLNTLPADEVEAILLHELAHIRRNDFLINLLQQFVEIFFFFNPGLLWVSSLIKNERENCCDDIAIAVTHDKKIFIHALVAFQEYNAGLTYATTFPGSKNHLLNRVKRIITNNNKTLSNMEKLVLASGIIITSMVALAFSPGLTKSRREGIKTEHIIPAAAGVDKKTIEETALKSNSSVTSPGYTYNKKVQLQKQKNSDTTTKTHYSGVIDGKKIQLTEENGQVKELYVDGKKIPEDQYKMYTTIIDKIHADMKENTAKLKMQSGLPEEQKEEMEQREIPALKEAQEMEAQNLLQQKEEIEQREIPALKEAQEIEAQNFLQQKKEMEIKNKLMKEDFYKERELMKEKQGEMQKEMKLSKKNEELMKSQSLKMQADLIKKQKQLQLKQVEFQKQVEKMKLQQEKFTEMIRDSIRSKRTKKEPAVYTRPGIFVKPEVIANSMVPAKPVIILKPVAFSAPVIKSVPVTSSTAISSVAIEPVAALTPVFAVKPVNYVSSGSISDEIIRDLEKANIISTRDNLSFRITNNELIVNGVKQTDAIHQNILKKYVRKPGDKISLNYSNSNRQ